MEKGLGKMKKNIYTMYKETVPLQKLLSKEKSSNTQ
jgi:hypothetical protein